MSETTCSHPGYCTLADALADLDGFHVIDVARSPTGLQVHVETDPVERFCPTCGAAARGDGRRKRSLHDLPVFGVPVRTIWHERTYRCLAQGCERVTFSETAELAVVGHRLTRRAVDWATRSLLTRDVAVSALAADLGVAWATLWDAVKAPLHERLDQLRDAHAIEAIGVDEHVWRHSGAHQRRMITGVVDHTRPPRDDKGKTKPFARLLDVTIGRSGPVAAKWLSAQGEDFTKGIRIAAFDPYRGYSNAVSATCKEADMVVDIFHVTHLAAGALDDTRRRVQQATLGRRGHKDDPLYRARRLLLTSAQHLSDQAARRLDQLLTDGDPDWEVTICWNAYQQIICAYRQKNATDMARLLAELPTCPVPEVAKLGRTLRSWKREILAYWTTDRSNNGPTEAINNVIETTRRVARGFRNFDNYRLRILASASGQRPYRNTQN